MPEVLFICMMTFGLLFSIILMFTLGYKTFFWGNIFSSLFFICGVFLLCVFIYTPIPPYTKVNSYDLFDGGTFIGVRTDQNLINITGLTGRKDISIDRYKYVEYVSEGRNGYINWLSRKKYELVDITKLDK